MGTLTASSSLSTNSGAASTKDVVDATASGINNNINLGTDSVTWTVSRAGANVIGETISVISNSNCSVSPSSTTMGTSATFTVNNFSGSSYSTQVSVTDTENSIVYYAKLQGSVSDATWTLDEENGLSQLSEGTTYAFDWTSNFTLNSGQLAQNNTNFQQAAALLGTGASSGTINLTTNNITNATASAAVTLRYNSTSGGILAQYNGTIYNSPPAPSISFSNITETSIKVTASGSGGTLQVSDDGTNWDTNGTTYSGLTHTTSYTFYAREINGPATSPTASASQSTLDATPSTTLQLGDWKTDATRNIYYYASCSSGSSPTTSEVFAGTFTVTGIDSGANVELSRALVSGTATSAQHKVNSGSWTSSNVQLVNGDDVKFRILAPSDYATAVRYSWTVENLNTDSLQITTEAAPNAPTAPTDISFSPASTANNNITVAVTASGGTGVIDSTSVRQGTTGSYSANGTSFNAIRGESETYQAINTNDGGSSAPYSESYTPPYLATDSTINAVANVTIPFTATSFSVTISPAESNQVYQLRTGSATGTIRASSSVGSGAITCSSGLPAATNPVGSPVTYYVTTYRTVASGGSGTSVDTGRTFTVTRSAPDTTPNAFDLGGPITGVEVSSGDYESDTITVTGINSSTSISISGGQYKIGTGSYTSSTGTVSLNDTVTVKVTAAATNSTTTTATLNIGGTTDTFSVTTEDPPPSGGTEGDGGAGTYGLRCYDSSDNITLDISDRVANEVEYITTSLSSTQTVKDITLSRAASGFIYMNPPQTVIDTTVTPAVIKDWLILDFELTTATNLRIKRQAHNNTAISSIQLLVFND